jgi:hypothetical protein
MELLVSFFLAKVSNTRSENLGEKPKGIDLKRNSIEAGAGKAI